MSDLETFFAKRDKKRQDKFKFTTVNDIEDKLKIPDENKKIKNPQYNDNEWKEFEEKKIDYTGLKILNSTVSEENIPEKDWEKMSACPWQGVDPKTEQQRDPPLNEGLVFESKKPAWMLLQPPFLNIPTYVPPHLRNRPVFSVKPKNVRLDIDNITSFPTLGSYRHRKEQESNRFNVNRYLNT